MLLKDAYLLEEQRLWTEEGPDSGKQGPTDNSSRGRVQGRLQLLIRSRERSIQADLPLQTLHLPPPHLPSHLSTREQ